jgi:virginiamycin B lyase
MHLVGRAGVAFALAFFLTPTAFAATITGSVTGPDGKPFMGAFVVAQNTQNKMTVNVLSDAQGRYHIGKLPAATYMVQISSIGYASDPRPDVKLTDAQKISFDFALKKTPVKWSDLSTYQGRKLLPKTKDHDLGFQDNFFVSCMQSCHSFQKRMAAQTGDKEVWRARLQYMRDLVLLTDSRRMSDEQAEDILSYLNTAFGDDSPKPKSPEEMPEYKSLVRPFSPEAMNIAYVEYDFPASLGMGPWSAFEGKDGMIWSPYFGRGNQVVRLNPKTGEFKGFSLPFTRMAGIHSAWPAKDGTVWFSEVSLGRLGHLDPATGKMTEYQNPPEDGKRSAIHTVREGEDGRIWASGGPVISRFDPKTETFEHFDLASTYGNAIGQNGDEWFTSFKADGPIGRISKDGVLSKFYPPTKGKPQRIQVDSDGIVWFSERQGNKMARFDPKTETFKEFPLPGPEASPYAVGIDRDHLIWYSSHEQDTLNRMDPQSGKVTEYPYPHSEISMREMNLDSQGRMWYASSVNNKIGYFYFNDDKE